MTEILESTSERNLRFEGLFKNTLHDFLNKTHVVVGVGAVGGYITRILGQIGVKNMIIWDHDTVEEKNIGPQGFTPASIDKKKVFVRAEDFCELNPDGECTAYDRRFQRFEDHPKDAIWWIMVDDLEVRQLIVDVANNHNPFKIIDARIGGTVYEIYNVLGKPLKKYQETIDFALDNPVQESCTTRTTPHAAMIAGALAINFGLAERPPYCVKGNFMSYDQEVIW